MPLPPASMLAMCATIVLCFLLPALLGLYAARRLGGVNGDVSGFTVVLSETLSLLLLTAVF